MRTLRSIVLGAALLTVAGAFGARRAEAQEPAAETERSISSLVNDAVKEALAEDAEDLQTFEDRISEPTVSFQEFVSDLKSRGRI